MSDDIETVRKGINGSFRDRINAHAALKRIERALKREQHVHAYWGMENCVTCGADRAPNSVQCSVYNGTEHHCDCGMTWQGE